MNILITGGAGFIGLSLAKKFSRNKKNKVYIIDIIEKKNFDRELKFFLKKNKNVFYKKIDLLNINKKLKIKDFQYIIHLAAQLGVENVISNPEKVMKFNILSTLEIIKFSKIKKRFKKLCFASTSEVYAHTVKRNNKLIPTEENVPILLMSDFSNRDSYLTSKFYGEMMIKYSNLPYVIFRPHNIYGPRMGTKHVIPQLIKRMYQVTNEIKVYSPNHTRSFCYIEDAVKMMMKTIKSNNKNETLNIGNHSDEIKIFDLAKKIKKISKKFILMNGEAI